MKGFINAKRSEINLENGLSSVELFGNRILLESVMERKKTFER
jgi:hypothetical protein